MKILFINSVCGIRSTGRIVTDLAEYYTVQGNEVKIAYGRETVPEKYRKISYRIGTDFDVKVNGLKARLWDNEGFNAEQQTNEFVKWADNYNPDLVWLHNLHGYYINIEILFRWIKTRPNMEVRWTLHDCWAFTGHCSHFSYVKCDRWKEKCFQCPQKKEYPKGLFLDNSFENYRRKKKAFCGVENMTVITPSKWLADLVKQSFLKDYPVEVVHNTIDTDVFRPTPSNFREHYGLQDKKIVLGVASSWGERKGMYDFFKLSELLDISFRIVMIGLSGEQIKKLPSSIIGIERTNSSSQLAEIYTAADVFVNLTYEDNYPTVNLEAQACGTPCITYRTGGSVESVPEDNIVEQGDLNAMVSKIQEICLKGKI